MLRETLSQIYENDLRRLIKEINRYESDADLWRQAQGISNSGGNLALHLTGNLKHFFGANLGGTGYRRERDLEFSAKNISREDLVRGLEEALRVVKDTLADLSDEQLHEVYPEKFGDRQQVTVSVIIYMLGHLNYHLGQINYHRRILSDSSGD